MKSFLIIPMGGTGSRFVKAGYRTYKPFLKVTKNLILLDNILDNFKFFNSEIIILTNLKKISKINLSYLKKKKL